MICDRILTTALSDRAPMPKLTRSTNPAETADGSLLASGKLARSATSGKVVQTLSSPIVITCLFSGAGPESGIEQEPSSNSMFLQQSSHNSAAASAQLCTTQSARMSRDQMECEWGRRITALPKFWQLSSKRLECLT